MASIPLPFHCAHARGSASAIHAADGRLLAMVTHQPGDNVALAETFALGPEALQTLVSLTFAICCLDDDYCAQHNVSVAPDGIQLSEAISDALACIRTAREVGIPIVPEFPT